MTCHLSEWKVREIDEVGLITQCVKLISARSHNVGIHSRPGPLDPSDNLGHLGSHGRGRRGGLQWCQLCLHFHDSYYLPHPLTDIGSARALSLLPRADELHLCSLRPHFGLSLLQVPLCSRCSC